MLLLAPSSYDARSTVSGIGGGGGGDYITKFCMGKLRPEVQTLTTSDL